MVLPPVLLLKTIKYYVVLTMPMEPFLSPVALIHLQGYVFKFTGSKISVIRVPKWAAFTGLECL